MKLSKLLNGRWIKHPRPVLGLGGPGEWDDLMADCPSIFSDGEGRYYIYYTGHSTRSHRWAIGLSESSDLFNWSKYEKNPVLTSGDKGEWDQRIDGPAVFKFGGMYYLFYEASSSFSWRQSRLICLIPYRVRRRLGEVRRKLSSLKPSTPASQAVEHAEGRSIGFASSKDLFNWVKYEGNPVLTPRGSGWDSRGVFTPYVHKAGDRFYMFYGGSDGRRIASGVATSVDLRRWERMEGPVLEPGPEGAWDDNSVLIVSVVRLEDAYCAFYEGQDSRNNYSIGFAYSTGNLAKWTKYEGNPILRKGPPGSPDERMVNSPHAILKNNGLFIFFGSQDYRMRGCSSIAYLDRRAEGRERV